MCNGDPKHTLVQQSTIKRHMLSAKISSAIKHPFNKTCYIKQILYDKIHCMLRGSQLQYGLQQKQTKGQQSGG